MGRQIAVAATKKDEDRFLSYLREGADIALIEAFSPEPQGLWVDSFDERLTGHWTYQIWNRAFAWKPEYKQTHVPENPERDRLFYVSNTNAAPLVEFSRSDVPQQQFGRIYLAKDFAAPKGLDYDVTAFTAWYECIVKWVRKNTAGKLKAASVTYFLVDAWRVNNELARGKANPETAQQATAADR